jgi:hypothetical protein
MRERMLVICPTSQAKGLRHVGTTGKSPATGKFVSSEQQLLRSACRPPVTDGERAILNRHT